MPSQDSWVFSRSLNQEERDWVRDLPRHPGYQIQVEAIKEYMAQALRQLLSSSDPEVLYRAQGSYQALDRILNIPALLLEVSPHGPTKENTR